MQKPESKYWHTKKGFINPEGRETLRGFRFTTVRWLLNRIFKKPYKIGKDLPENHLLTQTESKSFFAAHSNTPSMTWLGHASFIFRINGLTILTDPLLSGTPGLSLIRGLKRIPCPIRSSDFQADLLLLSHEHADHIHHPTLRDLQNKSRIQPITPLGLSKKIQKHNFKKVIELDWFDDIDVGHDVRITAVPAVHYSDFSNSTLWAGYIISFKDKRGEEKKIYFAGDTDYGSFIKRDIAPLGPFDIACVGVGGFHLSFPTNAEAVHTNPEEAIQIAQEFGVKKLIGMHWGTIRMGDENPNELLPRMKKHAEEIDYTGKITMLRIGETISI